MDARRTAGEYIGFTLDMSASFVVKAGNVCYAGEGTTWVHPDAETDPTASAISNIQICSVTPPHESEPDAGIAPPDDAAPPDEPQPDAGTPSPPDDASPSDAYECDAGTAPPPDEIDSV